MKSFGSLGNPTLAKWMLGVGFSGALVAQAQPDYAPAHWNPPCNANYYTSGFGHRFLVVHDMEGYYQSTITMFNRCGYTAASVNYLANGLADSAGDAAPGDLTQSVRESHYAWHACCWNQYSAGCEHEGFAGNPAWYTEAMYQASAGLYSHMCAVYGVAKDRNHIIAHGQKLVAGWSSWMAGQGYSSSYINCNSHTDPGPYWDWTHYMGLIVGGTDNAAFVSQTVANNTTFAPGQAFSCTWTMKNTGTLIWTANGQNGYTFNNYAGTAMGATFANPVAANVAPGANGSFGINFTAPAASGSYTANFQMNNSGSVYFGQQVSLTISVAAPGPTITTQPVSQTVAPGTTANFSVAATGSGTLSYHWRKDGVNLSNGGKISGATTATLTIANVQQTEVGNYSVVVTDANGSNTSGSATLAVSTVVAFEETFESGNLNNWGVASGTPGSTAWTISTAQNHTTGGTYSAHVAISTDRMYRNIGIKVAGRGRATFWIYDSSQVRVFAEVRSYSGNNYNSGSLDQLLAAGRYNSVTMPGEDSTVAYVNSHYQGRILYGPQNGWFNLNAASAPGRSAGWHKFELERLADQSTVNWYVDGILSRSFTGMTSPGWDSVVVGSTGTGTTAGEAWLDDLKVEYYDPLTITTQPANKTVSAGATATFTLSTSGTVTGYQWRKNGVILSNTNNISGATSATLTIGNAQAPDVASYDVVASNGTGPSDSASAALLVSPTIMTQPSGSTNLPATTATFTVVAAGQSLLSYQWQHEGTNVINGPNIFGATTDTLVLNSVNPTLVGNYSVVVTNAAGSATSGLAMLAVLELPTITTQPADQSVAAGSNVTFTVTASGTPPFYYQWLFNDIIIPGATISSYTRLNVQSADAGYYSVQVTNVAGSVFSGEAVLALINPRVAASFNVPDQTVALSWNAIDGKTYHVQYKLDLNDANWIDLPDVTASGSTVSVNDTMSSQARFYRITLVP